VGILALSTVSCGTVKVDAWRNPAYQGERLPGRTLVVGVARDARNQRLYEKLFVERLRAVGVEADMSTGLLPHDPKIPEEELREKIVELGVDSVIVTRVTGEVDKGQYSPTARVPAYDQDYYDYYDAAFDLTQSPGSGYNYTEFHLETHLYDAKTGDLVWSGRNTVTDQQSDEKAMLSVISAIIGDLQKKGLM
jgi:hypothetical protein